MVFLKGLFEASAKTHGQHSVRQEVVGVFGTDPAETIGGKTATGNDTMDVGMKAEVTRPGLEHGEQAKFGAEVFVLAADVQQRSSTLAQQNRVKVFLMRTNDRAQFGRNGEGDQVIRDGQEAAALAGEPLGSIAVAALGAGAVIAGVISKVLASALAAEELASECRGAATENGRESAAMRREQARAELPLVGRPMTAQDLGQSDQRPEGLEFEWLVECGESSLGFGFADGSQVGVNNSGV